jgi:glycosyltransferase involved in cell wall biosynthesis
MRIGFFTYGMDGERMTGIARYTVELTRALRILEPTLQISLLNPYPASRHPWYGEFDVYPVPALRGLPMAATFGNVQLHRAALDLDLDILHDPAGIAPFIAPRGQYRRVVTVHDAVPFIYPHAEPVLTRLVFNTLVRRAGASADAVITVSRSAAADLERLAGIPPSKTAVTPNGVSVPGPMSEQERESHLARLELQPPYILVVGALHPRKNLPRILRAFDTLRVHGETARLVIVGPRSWGANGIYRMVIDRASAADDILYLGFVHDRVLDALYFRASLLAFPSLYEGFGLPALEAMVRGTPVLTSNVGSLPEVVGDAAVLVDPLSTDAMSDGMTRLLHDSGLRSELSRRGLERARQYTWERTAAATLRVYRSIT